VRRDLDEIAEYLGTRNLSAALAMRDAILHSPLDLFAITGMA
jgi:plasmid stabilization system protein ParE